MQNSNLNINELIHHLDITTTDPIVRRLIDLLLTREATLADELIDAGMDPTSYTFYYDGSSEYSPGEFITELRKNVDYLEQDLQCAQEDLACATAERDRLSTRSVASLLASMEEIVKRTKADSDNVNRQIIKVEQENHQLKDKINVWKVMES